MDLASDTSHLYDDAKFGDECTKLDVKNRLETKHQNIRALKTYEFVAKTLDRSSNLVKKEHDREIKSIRDGLQDIYIKTPYFETFWNLDVGRSDGFDVRESIKDAVVNRILGRSSRPDIETVHEDQELEVSASRSVPTRKNGRVRRTKSEPIFPSDNTSPDNSRRSRRIRSDSLSALHQDEKAGKLMHSTSASTTCIFPIITDLNNSNKDLRKYDPVVYTKPTKRKSKRSISVPELSDVSKNNKAYNYVRKAKAHSKTLDSIYTKRAMPKEEYNDEDKGLEFEELPENSILRAHFIAQVNSRKRLQVAANNQKTLLSDISEVWNT